MVLLMILRRSTRESKPPFDITSLSLLLIGQFQLEADAAKAAPLPARLQQ
jgi:hypothetical protein